MCANSEDHGGWVGHDYLATITIQVRIKDTNNLAAQIDLEEVEFRSNNERIDVIEVIPMLSWPECDTSVKAW